MAKKTKRQASKNIARPAQAAPAVRSTTVMANKPVEFNPDYSYVLKDLRRIAILAGSFVAILVVLSFFLK
jgi:hypothetical protein